MRIRSIKPEFWRSTDISDLSLADRLLFIGLWSYVDDNGVGIYDIAIITAELFAHDLSREPIETLSRVSAGCERLAEEGLIALYRVKNQDYLFVAAWEAHQRVNNPNKPRFPRPDAETATLLRPDVDPKESLPPGTGEQRSRGTGEQSTNAQPQAVERAHPPQRFDEFWNHFPRKVGKDKARTAYESACKRATEETILQGAIRFANDPNLPEKQFIPHPTTWLNRGGWDDEPLPPRTDGRAGGGYRSQNDIMRDMQTQARTSPNPLTLIEGSTQ